MTRNQRIEAAVLVFVAVIIVVLVWRLTRAPTSPLSPLRATVELTERVYLPLVTRPAENGKRCCLIESVRQRGSENAQRKKERGS